MKGQDLPKSLACLRSFNSPGEKVSTPLSSRKERQRKKSLTGIDRADKLNGKICNGKALRRKVKRSAKNQTPGKTSEGGGTPRKKDSTSKRSSLKLFHHSNSPKYLARLHSFNSPGARNLALPDITISGSRRIRTPSDDPKLGAKRKRLRCDSLEYSPHGALFGLLKLSQESESQIDLNLSRNAREPKGRNGSNKVNEVSRKTKQKCGELKRLQSYNNPGISGIGSVDKGSRVPKRRRRAKVRNTYIESMEKPQFAVKKNGSKKKEKKKIAPTKVKSQLLDVDNKFLYQEETKLQMENFQPTTAKFVPIKKMALGRSLQLSIGVLNDYVARALSKHINILQEIARKWESKSGLPCASPGFQFSYIFEESFPMGYRGALPNSSSSLKQEGVSSRYTTATVIKDGFIVESSSSVDFIKCNSTSVAGIVELYAQTLPRKVNDIFQSKRCICLHKSHAPRISVCFTVFNVPIAAATVVPTMADVKIDGEVMSCLILQVIGFAERPEFQTTGCLDLLALFFRHLGHRLKLDFQRDVGIIADKASVSSQSILEKNSFHSDLGVIKTVSTRQFRMWDHVLSRGPDIHSFHKFDSHDDALFWLPSLDPAERLPSIDECAIKMLAQFANLDFTKLSYPLLKSSIVSG